MFHDSFGKRCQEMFEDKTMERKPQAVASIPKLPGIIEDARAPKLDPSLSKRLEDSKLTEKVNLFFF